MDPILIPLALILGGFGLSAYSIHRWFEYKSRDGGSTRELEADVAALREALERSEEERARLTERMENVETIVTSEAPASLPEETERRTLGSGSGAAQTEEETPGATQEGAPRLSGSRNRNLGAS